METNIIEVKEKIILEAIAKNNLKKQESDLKRHWQVINYFQSKEGATRLERNIIPLRKMYFQLMDDYSKNGNSEVLDITYSIRNIVQGTPWRGAKLGRSLIC